MGYLISNPNKSCNSCKLSKSLSGESHIWYRDDRKEPATAVIDMGYASSQHWQAAQRANPQIVILTHNDQDHIGGATQFFKHLSANIHPQELWVPYDWTYLIDTAYGILGQQSPFIPPKQTASHTPIHTISKVQMDSLGIKSDMVNTAKKQYYNAFDDLLKNNVLRDKEIDGLDSSLQLLFHDINSISDLLVEDDSTDAKENFPQLDQHIAEITNNLTNKLFTYLQPHNQINLYKQAQLHLIQRELSISDNAMRLLQQSSSTRYLAARAMTSKFKSTATILFNAISHSIKVRYFDTTNNPQDSWKTEGKPGIITFANAHEKHYTVTYHAKMGKNAALTAFLHTYMLTLQNKKAIAPVLWNESNGNNPNSFDDGILIWSDTDASMMSQGKCLSPTFWEKIVLMTAPHHGSTNPAHQIIWDAWKNIAHSKPKLLLAGGTKSQGTNVAADFTNHPNTERSCTGVRHYDDPYSRTLTTTVNNHIVTFCCTCSK